MASQFNNEYIVPINTSIIFTVASSRVGHIIIPKPSAFNMIKIRRQYIGTQKIYKILRLLPEL